MRIGLISDTHGRLDPRAYEALAGVERIIHAGDVGAEAVLDELETIAPVTAVRGNMDLGPLAFSLPTFAVVEAEGVRIGAAHRRSDVPADADLGSLDVLVLGHSHIPEVRHRDGLLVVNPGSTSRAGAHAKRGVAVLEVADGTAHATLLPFG